MCETDDADSAVCVRRTTLTVLCVCVRRTMLTVQCCAVCVCQMDNADSTSVCVQLKKAYFRQLEEIRSLKEQVALKDKRIRLLESELNSLKEKESSLGPGESNC